VLTPVIAGAACSSLQAEGAAPASDWGGWEAAGWVPASRDGNGFASRYADDAALLAQHGLGSLRLTLEWARLEPRPSERGFDAVEVERYRRILRAVREAGLEAWACLAHTSLPGWYSEDERGFLDERMARRVWPRHVDRVAEAFGDLVDGWVTFHEPVRHALDAWLHGTLPPARRDGDDARRGLRLLLEADAHAARLLATGPAPVATCHWLPDVRPADGTPACKRAADAAVELVWDSWRRLDTGGAWVGVSSAYGIAVTADGAFHRRGPALDEVLHRLPDRPVVVLTGAVEDDEERADEVTRHLDAAVAEAVDDRVDVRQVHWWSAVDGYEGWRGFDLRTGLFDRDRNPALVRSLAAERR